MGEMVKTLQDNWAVIAGAPWAFVIVAVLLAGVIWLIITALKKHQIKNLDARLKLRDDEIADYKRRLHGATPEEAGKRIAELERQVIALQPKQRVLTQDQKSCIGRHIAGRAFSDRDLGIIYVGSSPESAIYAYDFKEALALGGWSVEPDIILFGTRVLKKGVTLAATSSDKHQAISTILAAALRDADVQFKEECTEGLDEVRLFVDMIP